MPLAEDEGVNVVLEEVVLDAVVVVAVVVHQEVDTRMKTVLLRLHDHKTN
jgi:hypothetical protein